MSDQATAIWITLGVVFLLLVIILLFAWYRSPFYGTRWNDYEPESIASEPSSTRRSSVMSESEVDIYSDEDADD